MGNRTSLTVDFSGIGASKAGTTWVAACLAEHPGICMSQPKELNFFCERTIWKDSVSNHDRGIRWFERRFPTIAEGQILGEFSVNYLFDPASPQLLYSHSPTIKLIACFRNPADRLYSLYYQFAKEYRAFQSGSFEDFIDSTPDFIESGLYHKQIMRFYEVFPKNQIHIILFDDIAKKPQEVIKALFTFLGVDATFVPDAAVSRVNERKEPRFLLLRDSIHSIKNVLNSSRGMKHIKHGLAALGFEKLANALIALNLKEGQFPSMRPETRKKLLAYYAADVNHLSALIGRDLSSWLT